MSPLLIIHRIERRKRGRGFRQQLKVKQTSCIASLCAKLLERSLFFLIFCLTRTSEVPW